MEAKDKCPISGCGGRLVVRTNRGTEEQFLGCSNYPKCRYTEPIDDEDDDDEESDWWNADLYDDVV